ncbi:zinc-ribbon domain-containing protein [Acetobacterium fimetarium]|uniref:Zinc-ribbon domain-containing protein n=1 Tax=Acetobacterium fimetarium TaxID=52691 RepID=A0ABR6WR69_9FIRM|nr:zinc ribbon domain-containing protein [Acetobacterium fimetarium]MBC3803010.1 zinc-ribbon domain-containing protein [Acetobacterium fimetarium]
MFCKKCGAPIKDDAEFCTKCGTPADKGATPSDHASGLVGWSTRWEDPEIIAASKKNNMTVIGFTWALALILPIGFLVAGLFIDSLKLADAMIIGFSLAAVLLCINLIHLKIRKNQTWEGVVTEKYVREKPADDESENEDIDTEYVLVVQKTNGKIHHVIYLNRREMYDYFAIGDRIRYHQGLGTYEKYDKSGDRIIYCNVCSAENPITNDRCVRCNRPLLK